MSSKIPHGLRIQRGKPKYLTDLPVKIQNVLKSIYSTCGSVGLYGSYARGDWAEDSDLDIGIKDFRSHTQDIRAISQYFGIHIDVNELNENYHLVIIP